MKVEVDIDSPFPTCSTRELVDQMVQTITMVYPYAKVKVDGKEVKV